MDTSHKVQLISSLYDNTLVLVSIKKVLTLQIFKIEKANIIRPTKVPLDMNMVCEELGGRMSDR